MIEKKNKRENRDKYTHIYSSYNIIGTVISICKVH